MVGELGDAIHGHRVVEFDYVRRGDSSRRRVEPHRQLNRQLSWYLLAWDLDKSDWRVFRHDRISELRTRPEVFTARQLPAMTASAYLDGGLHRDRQRVVVTVAAPLADIAAALAYQDAELTPLDEDRTRLVLHLDDWRWLLLNLAFLDADFVIEEPPEFARAANAFAQRLVAATAPAARPRRQRAYAPTHARGATR